MDIGQIFRESWRISTHYWSLWLLMLAIFVVFIPTMVLIGGLAGVSAIISQDWTGLGIQLITPLREVSTVTWLLIIGAALLITMASAAAAWCLQAAAMRGSAMAADRASFTLVGALSLGRRRFFNIVKLSFIFGIVLAILTVFPAFLGILLRESDFGLLLVNFTQTSMLPLNTILGVVVLLVMMSIALEDVTPRIGFRRAWQVFRSGWWGFLLVMATTVLLSVLPVLILLPLLLIAPLIYVLDAGWAPLVICASVVGPLSLLASLFSAVFTLVLYTLIYRASAKMAGGEIAPEVESAVPAI